MCFANLGTLVCQSCGRRVGEQPVGTTSCILRCGKFVSRVTGQVVAGECAVCEERREERENLTARLNRAFGREDGGWQAGGGHSAVVARVELLRRLRARYDIDEYRYYYAAPELSSRDVVTTTTTTSI